MDKKKECPECFRVWAVDRLIPRLPRHPLSACVMVPTVPFLTRFHCLCNFELGMGTYDPASNRCTWFCDLGFGTWEKLAYE